MGRLLPFPALVALALAPGAAQAQDTTVATLERPADIGTNSSGNPQVIFSLDVGPVPGGQAGMRDLFVIALDEDAARPVRNANTNKDEVSPTIDEGRIAFTRVYPEGEGRVDDKPIVYTKRLVAPRERPSTRLAGVPTSRGGSTTDQRGLRARARERAAGTDRALHLRLRGVQPLHLRGTPSRARRPLVAPGRDPARRHQRPVLRRPVLRRGLPGVVRDSNLGNRSAGAYRYRPGRAYRFAEGPPYPSGFGWTGTGTWQVRASYGQSQGECDDVQTNTVEQCTLARTDDLDWEVVAADRVR